MDKEHYQRQFDEASTRLSVARSKLAEYIIDFSGEAEEISIVDLGDDTELFYPSISESVWKLIVGDGACIAAIELRCPAGHRFGKHVHPVALEHITVLEGAATFFIGACNDEFASYYVSAGESIEIPPGIEHDAYINRDCHLVTIWHPPIPMDIHDE